ncbi:MAG: hypothetical protein JWN04_337, partial [Myxococcaceae bacterium]|nr:hypothetical protein [Myxococcaceae bacterium]
MSQTMEKTDASQPDGEDPPEDKKDQKKKKRIKVRVTLYYDGTQNNRANTNVRKNVESGQERGQSDADYEKSLDLFLKYGMSGSSYDNDESNVSRLEGQALEQASGYDRYFRVYTEGIGTLDEDSDSLLGQALGAFETGIYAKVDIGIKNLLSTLVRKLDPAVVIEELALDTCGFSRGAAAARFAIHRALNDKWWGPSSLKTSLEASGFEVEKVKVLAVCLFDTVSSYGLPIQHSGNVKKLKLDAIRHARAVLQLAAAEEYRENFSLTTIESAGSKGRHVYLPGAHSDIGGCYEDGMVEEKILYKGDGVDDIAKFLLARGWYTA